ncbi:Sugar-specific transcriptional regulator TrmB [Halorubrum aquaticum]|uniref:Sugar-specific transcriptional regulator TrmB n=1 Tax=Halorubrum aquaticum TaxID=387340 RepID=A0A1I3ADQ6_9EURY|nr:helix-turn-helix domain-containing protein [Halorubrum aquaticum]SFH48085.1 Sugar-specific transcriptional regulator TrmB [Halorubrum aquaticum]
MTRNDSDDPRSTAVDQLEAFGLSTYAARTFVALASLGEGTAKDVSALAEVPRTRVYDATAELREYGLVDVQQSTPKRFTAVSAETTGRRFRREYTRRADLLTNALDEIEPASPNAEQRGVWTVTGREMVSDRVVEFVGGASEEVVLVTLETLLTDDVLAAVRAAIDRGVTVRVSGMDFSATEGDIDRLPDGCGFESSRAWSGVPAGRLLMVDRRRTLASVLVDGDGEHPPDARDETAIWGAGENNSLVVVLKAMFAWLNGGRE